MGELVRVTQVIAPWTDFSAIPEAVLQNAADRGTAVHEICARIASGEFVVSIPAEYQGYIDSFRRWFDSQVSEVFMAENRLVDLAWGYTGQIDLLVMTREDLIILVDLKTPVAAYKQWQIQLSAYHNLVMKAGYLPERCGSLRLSPDGKVPVMKWYENTAQDFNLFTQALNLHKFFNS